MISARRGPMPGTSILCSSGSFVMSFTIRRIMSRVTLGPGLCFRWRARWAETPANAAAVPEDAILNPSHFSRHESTQPFQFAFTRRIVSEEFTGEPDGAERQAHRFADLSAAGQRKLTATAPEVHQQHGIRIDPAIRNNAQMNQ